VGSCFLKQRFINFFCKIAKETAELSHAKRLKVGCVIVKDNRILSIGYNGTPAGWDNKCEDLISHKDIGIASLVTKPEVLHAEANALMKLARSTESSEGASLFQTHAPCLDCAKMIYQAGIESLYFIEDYRFDQGVKFLEKSGVNVCQVK
jgi:dCMP deaminase